MSLYKTCYDTTFGSIFTNTVQKIKKDLISILDDYDLFYGTEKLNLIPNYDIECLFITGKNSLNSKADSIPIFNHSILIEDKRKKYLITDLRMYLKPDTSSNALYETKSLSIDERIRNIPEFNFHKNRAILTMLWSTNKTLEIQNTLFYANKIFCTLLANNITKAYNLDFRQKTIIEIITCFYYQNLFSNDLFNDEDEIMASIIHTIKVINAPDLLVKQVYESIPKSHNKPILNNINEYCSTIKKVLDDRKLNNFELSSLLTIISSSWYGTGYKELLGCGLEHPPTWIVVVETCINNKGYKATTIANLINNSKKDDQDTFIKNINVLLNNYQKNE